MPEVGLHTAVTVSKPHENRYKDENVFDIQQGVAIGIFVKEPGRMGPARVRHADLWGLREHKHQRLFEEEIQTTLWTPIVPQSPFYLFVPRSTDLETEYREGWQVAEIFPVNSVGVVTARDNLTINWTPEEVWKTVRDFAALPAEEARERYILGEDVRDWKVHLAQEDVR